MTGAIGAPFRRREPAIGVIPAPRIAERPTAGKFANILEPHPPHLSDLGVGERPCRPPFRFKRPVWGTFPGRRGRGETNSLRRRPMRGRARPAGRGSAPAVELDSDPVRLADHGVAGLSAQRRGDDARAHSLQCQPFESLDRLVRPKHSRPQWVCGFGGRKVVRS